MFGMRKATKNASVTPPAPNARATSMSRAKPSTRLASVAAPMAPSAPTTCRSWGRSRAVSVSLTLKNLRRSGMIHGGPRDPDTTRRKEPPGGEHDVGEEADPSERAQAPAQPRRSLEGPHGRQARTHERGRRDAHDDRGGHPRARPGRQQGRHPPQHRRPQEV